MGEPLRAESALALPPTKSDVVAFCRTGGSRPSSVSPRPTRDLGHIVPVTGDVLLVLDELVANCLLGISGARTELGDTIDHIADEVETVEFVHDAHIERRTGGAFLLVAAHMQVVMTVSPVGQAVNEPRISMEGKDDRLVRGKQRIVFMIIQAVRMLARRLQLHEIDDIDDTDLQLRHVPA